MSAFLPGTEETALRERFLAVRARLEKAAAASGRALRDIHLVAVSKNHSAAMVAALTAMWSGLPQNSAPTFGENYVQEAVDKQTAVASLLLRSPASVAPEWHFTGHLQSRKAREVAGRFALIHTLDSDKLAGQIQKAVQQENLPPQNVLIQVNIGEEEQKSGVSGDEAEKLITAVMAMPELAVQGLMCLPPFFDEGEKSRPYFAKLRELRDALSARTGLALRGLSMGMSHDFEIAVAEGATIVRVGTDIFGARPPKA